MLALDFLVRCADDEDEDALAFLRSGVEARGGLGDDAKSEPVYSESLVQAPLSLDEDGLESLDISSGKHA